MDEKRDNIAAWVAHEILPHESAVRSWLSRRWGRAVDPDDVIQEAYCRISNLANVDHIDNPIGYFRCAVHTAAADALRRASILNFTSMTEIEWLNVIDNEPLADRALEAGQELGRVNALLSQLSNTCRQAIMLRRVEGVSQREAAQRLGVSEDVIRNHLVRGVRKILQAMTAQDAEVSSAATERAKG